jgi:hypothetical protein
MAAICKVSTSLLRPGFCWNRNTRPHIVVITCWYRLCPLNKKENNRFLRSQLFGPSSKPEWRLFISYLSRENLLTWSCTHEVKWFKKSIFWLRFCLKKGYEKYQVLVSSWALADMNFVLMQYERNEKVSTTISIGRTFVETGNGIYSFLIKSWELAGLILCKVKWQIKILNIHHYCDHASAETGKGDI